MSQDAAAAGPGMEARCQAILTMLRPNPSYPGTPPVRRAAKIARHLGIEPEDIYFYLNEVILRGLVEPYKGSRLHGGTQYRLTPMGVRLMRERSGGQP